MTPGLSVIASWTALRPLHSQNIYPTFLLSILYTYFLYTLFFFLFSFFLLIFRLTHFTQPREEIRRLLHFVVVGGGPSGVEYVSELNDFLKDDLNKHFPHVCSCFKLLSL